MDNAITPDQGVGAGAKTGLPEQGRHRRPRQVRKQMGEDAFAEVPDPAAVSEIVSLLLGYAAVDDRPAREAHAGSDFGSRATRGNQRVLHPMPPKLRQPLLTPIRRRSRTKSRRPPRMKSPGASCRTRWSLHPASRRRPRPPMLGPPTFGPPTFGPPTLGPPTLGPPTLGPPTLGPPRCGVLAPALRGDSQPLAHTCRGTRSGQHAGCQGGQGPCRRRRRSAG